MNQISVTFYTIKLRPKYQKAKSSLLLDSYAESADFWDFIKDHYLNNLIPRKQKPSAKQIEGLDNDSLVYIDMNSLNVGQRVLSGLMYHGDSGFSSVFTNPRTGSDKYAREIMDRELIPFYFLVDIPKGRDVGVLVLQTFGKYSFGTTVRKSIKSAFEEGQKDILVEISPLLLGDLVIDEYLSEGKLKGIEMIKYSQPKDIATVEKNSRVKCVLNLSPVKRNTFFMGKLKDAFKALKPNAKSKDIIKEVTEIFDLDISGFQEMNFICLMGGKKHKINISNLLDCATRIDVTDEVLLEDNGHPNFKAIDTYVRNILVKQINPKLRSA